MSALVPHALPATLCRGCQVHIAEFPSIYCEGCLEEIECTSEAHDNLAVEAEELEEGFQIVSPRGILQRSTHNAPLAGEEEHCRVVTLAAIIVFPASALNLL